MLQLLLISTALAAPTKHSSDAASRIRRAARNRASNDVGVDPLPLQGKLAIVTGGGRGIGAAVAKALAQRGCRVIITYRSNVEAAADTMMALPGDGHDARQCDVTDADAVAQLFEDVDALLEFLRTFVRESVSTEAPAPPAKSPFEPVVVADVFVYPLKSCRGFREALFAIEHGIAQLAFAQMLLVM